MKHAVKLRTDQDPVSAFAFDMVRQQQAKPGSFELLACERHLHDRLTGYGRGMVFDARSAVLGISFLQFARAGFPDSLPRVPITPSWENFVIGSIFGWRRADGTRCHDGKGDMPDLLNYALREGIVSDKNMIDYDNQHLLRDGPTGA